MRTIIRIGHVKGSVRQEYITGLKAQHTLHLTRCLRSVTLPRSGCQFDSGSRPPVWTGSSPCVRCCCCWDNRRCMLGAAWFRHLSHRASRALFHSHSLSWDQACSPRFHGVCCRTAVRTRKPDRTRTRELW